MWMPAGSDAGLVPADASAAVGLAQVLSHATLVFGVVQAGMREGCAYLWAHGVAGLLTSVVYHVCRADFYCFGMTRDTTRRNDHMVNLALGGALFLHLLLYDQGRDTGAAARVLLWPVVIAAVGAYPYQLQSMVLVVLYLIVVAVDRYFRVGALLPPRIRDYRPQWLALGALALALGLGSYFYASDAPRNNAVADGLVHSAWHVLVGVALWFFCKGVVPPPPPS